MDSRPLNIYFIITLDTKGLKETINLIKVVLADTKGAFEGAAYGKGIVGKAACAILGAVLASAIATIQISISGAPAQASKFDVAQYRYAELKLNPIYDEKMDYWQSKTGLTLDSKYDNLFIVGRSHNVILEMTDLSSNLNIYEAFTSDEWPIVSSESFISSRYIQINCNNER